MRREGIPETMIFYDPATRYYGFKTRFPSQGYYHNIMATFDTMQDALDWTDPHRENIWEEPSDAVKACC